MKSIKNWLTQLKNKRKKKKKAKAEEAKPVEVKVDDSKPITFKIEELKSTPECKDNTDLILDELIEKYRRK